MSSEVNDLTSLALDAHPRGLQGGQLLPLRGVGERVLVAETQSRPLDEEDARLLGVPDAPVDALASVLRKRTAGSTQPQAVAASIAATRATIAALGEALS